MLEKGGGALNINEKYLSEGEVFAENQAGSISS